MKLIKREYKISHKDFCSIFTNRSFSKRDKLFKSIYFVEDVDGDYRIEERVTFVGWLILLILTPLLILPSIILFGILGTFEVLNSNKDTFSGRPTRVDECKHNIKSTTQLLELTGWDN